MVCKPGSVPHIKQGACHLSEPAVTNRLYRSTLWHWTSSPYSASLHDLSTSKKHSPYVAIRLVGSYLTFSPLPPKRRLFSSALLNPRGLLPVKKWNALCCPDFPPASRRYTRQADQLFLFWGCKISAFSGNYQMLQVFNFGIACLTECQTSLLQLLIVLMELLLPIYLKVLKAKAFGTEAVDGFCQSNIHTS